MTAEGDLHAAGPAEVAPTACCVSISPVRSQARQVPPAETSRHGDENRRPVIAVDIDEVLCFFVQQLCEYHNGKYSTNLTPDDFQSYYFHQVWGGTREEADAKMVDFFQSSHFLDGLPIVKGAAEVLRKYADRLEMHVVTSRQNVLKQHTFRWIETHYPGIFKELHFGNHFGKGRTRSKPDLCRAINAIMIIDDNANYAQQCAAAGIRTCLFGDYAWNRTVNPLPGNVCRTLTWADVDVQLQAVADSKPGAFTYPVQANTGALCILAPGEKRSEEDVPREGRASSDAEQTKRASRPDSGMPSGDRASCVEITPNANTAHAPSEQASVKDPDIEIKTNRSGEVKCGRKRSHE